MSFASLAGCVS